MGGAVEAGVELDAMIAARVAGLDVHEVGEPVYEGYGSVGERTVYVIKEGNAFMEDLPCFSTDIAAAWQAVERLKHPVGGSTPESSMAVARFAHWWDHAGLWLMSPAEAAHAICVNLLAAVGHKPD